MSDGATCEDFTYLKRRNIVGIADIDTRRLTRILREKGAQNGCLVAGDNIDEEAALNVNTHPSNYGKQLLVDPNFYIGRLGELTERFDTLIQQ